MIGPKHFRQWVVPELEQMARFLEYNMYHLDGTLASRHLPMILEIDELRGIQYGAGHGHTLDEEIPVFKRIQEAGRVQYFHVPYDRVEEILQVFDPRGLLIFTTAPSIEAADALLENGKRWSARGVVSTA